jgi:hypothetical protein
MRASCFFARAIRREVLPYDDVLLDVPDLRAETFELAEAGELREQLRALTRRAAGPLPGRRRPA